MRPAGCERDRQRHALAGEMILPDHLGKRTRTQALGKRHVPTRPLFRQRRGGQTLPLPPWKRDRGRGGNSRKKIAHETP